MTDSIADQVFSAPGARLTALIHDPGVTQVHTLAHDRLFYEDAKIGPGQLNEAVFPNRDVYIAWIKDLLKLTDAKTFDVERAVGGTIQASFTPASGLAGGVIVATPQITGGDPDVTVRKQPINPIELETLLSQQVMASQMFQLLQVAVQGRLNILVSGGGGAGKTTLLRAMFGSGAVDAMHHIVTAEDGNKELVLDSRLSKVSSLVTHVERDESGKVLWEADLDALVTNALRMRADRIIVGETRGKEAASLAKACLSGHDGSATTIHASSPRGALRQLVTYLQMADMPEAVARDQATNAFDLIVQIRRISPTRRVITHIVESENTREDTEDRLNPLFGFDVNTGQFNILGQPTPPLIQKLADHGVDYNQAMQHSY